MERIDEWFYPVINIDNMMNLELLYFATKVTQEIRFMQISLICITWKLTVKNQVPCRLSSNYHVVNYTKETESVLHKKLLVRIFE